MNEASKAGVLAGRTIWLTRPAGQCETLANRIETLGAKVVSLPLLEIQALDPSPGDREKLLNLDRYDLVIYVSTNAAQIGLETIARWWPQYPAGLRNFAVGPATAAVLEEAGLVVDWPRDGSSSEALLALPQLRQLQGRKALIVRGRGGRELLAQSLRERGAAVDYVELYTRNTPRHAEAFLRECLARHYPDALVLSSGEAIDNLRQLLAPVHADWQGLPLLVSSGRLAEHAAGLGFTRVGLMSGAGDEAIIGALLSSPGAQVSPS